MQRGQAKGGARGQGPQKVGALGVAEEQRERQQELGAALDSLVHAVRLKDRLSDGIARRCREILLEQMDDVIEWHATELRRGGRMLLQAGKTSGRFIHPAYVAGLRVLALRPQSTAQDLLHLAQELGLLESGERSIEDFADWLWRAGAHGFDVALTEPLAMTGETLVGDFDQAQFWNGRSSHAVEIWNTSAWSAAEAYPSAVLQEQFARPLERLTQAIAGGELSFSVDDARALRTAVDDPRLWAPAKISLLLQEPSLRAALPVSHLGFLTGSWIEAAKAIDPRMLDVADELGIHGADARALGLALGRHLVERDFDANALLALVDRGGGDLLSGLVNELASEAEQPDRARAPLLLLLKHLGRARFFELVQLPEMSPPLLGAVLRAVMDEGADAAVIGGWLQGLPADNALRAVLAEPKLVSIVSPLVTQLIATHPEHSGPLLLPFIEASPACARCVGTALVRQHCDGFLPEAVKPALIALREQGFGEPFVLPLWLQPAVAARVRVAALFALEADAQLRAKAFARRPTSSDSIEVREAFEELQWKGNA